jgi:predicted RNA binding protein YcfA (HicA-like mRNA interferase family)
MNDIKLRDANKILKKNGYTLNRIVGDHYHYYNNNNRRLTLVFHMKRDNSCPGAIWKKTCKQHNIKY